MDQVTSVMDNENKSDLPGSNYSGSVKKELDQLVIFLHHFLHLGWEVGPVDIEMEEVYPQGNLFWESSTPTHKKIGIQ